MSGPFTREQLIYAAGLRAGRAGGRVRTVPRVLLLVLCAAAGVVVGLVRV